MVSCPCDHHMTCMKVTRLAWRSHDLHESHTTCMKVTWLTWRSHDLHEGHMTCIKITWLTWRSHNLHEGHMTCMKITWLAWRSHDLHKDHMTITWLTWRSHDYHLICVTVHGLMFPCVCAGATMSWITPPSLSHSCTKWLTIGTACQTCTLNSWRCVCVCAYVHVCVMSL